MESAEHAASTCPPVLGSRVELQLLTTLKCNLRCSYCSLGVESVLGSQKAPVYTARQLRDFVRTQLPGKEIYFTFYGGEPTLNTRFALEVIEEFPLSRFNMQTNGTLLHRVPGSLLARLSNILVSIDGGEAVTDAFRGKGVYRKVLANVAAIRRRTHATLTARVTWWSGETSCEDFCRLTEIFDYVYFQFAQDDGAYSPESVRGKKRVLAQLVERFFEQQALYPVVPIMGTVRNKLLPWKLDELTRGFTQCRVSTNLLNVMPDGRIYPCPDMLYAGDLEQGNVVANWLKRSPLQPHPDMPCTGCAAYPYCRGHCMKNMHLAYVRNDENWRTKVVEPTCELIRFMGEEVDRHDPHRWFSDAPVPVRKAIADAEIYEFCEVMP